MNLHTDKKIIGDTIRVAAQQLIIQNYQLYHIHRSG